MSITFNLSDRTGQSEMDEIRRGKRGRGEMGKRIRQFDILLFPFYPFLFHPCLSVSYFHAVARLNVRVLSLARFDVAQDVARGGQSSIRALARNLDCVFA